MESDQQFGISHKPRHSSIRFPTHAHLLRLKKLPPHYAVVVWFIAMSPSLLENLQFGVIEIGSFVGVFLLGVLFLQTFNYYNMFPDDGWVNKTLVRSEVTYTQLRS